MECDQKMTWVDLRRFIFPPRSNLDRVEQCLVYNKKRQRFEIKEIRCYWHREKWLSI